MDHGGPQSPGRTARLNASKAAGSYTCTVTAINQAGNGAATSAPLTIKAAKSKLIIKTKKPKAKPGKSATIKVQVYNQGDLRSKSSRVCLKPTKAQRKFVRQPKCKQIGKVASKKRKAAKLNVKLKGDAESSYKLKIVIKGTGGKAGSRGSRSSARSVPDRPGARSWRGPGECRRKDLGSLAPPARCAKMQDVLPS